MIDKKPTATGALGGFAVRRAEVRSSTDIAAQAPHESARPIYQDYSLSIPLPYDVESPAAPPRIVVVSHIFHPHIAREVRRYLENIPFNFDLFISTDNWGKGGRIRDAFRDWHRGSLEVRVFPNRGRDIAPKIAGFRDVYEDYDLTLHIHTKRSDHASALFTWRGYLFETLLGSPEVVSSIVEIFETSPRIGMVAAQHFEPVRHWINWGGNYPMAAALADRMGVPLSEDAVLDFPSGSMFWARTDALKPLLDLELSTDDFDVEKGQIDATLAHAIERLYFFVCEKAGFDWVKVARRQFMPNTPCMVATTSRDKLSNYIARHTLRLTGDHCFEPRAKAEPPISQPAEALLERLEHMSSDYISEEKDAGLLDRLAGLEAENAALRRIRADTWASTSWRVTKPLRFVSRLLRRGARFPLDFFGRCDRCISRESPHNAAALQALAESRQQVSSRKYPFMYAAAPSDWPQLDLTIVTYNSERWLDRFFASVAFQNYPLDRINIYVTDNGSTDGTPERLKRLSSEIGSRFAGFHLESAPNRGFGAGHNRAVRRGTAPLVLVTNVDLEFSAESLTQAVSVAVADRPEVACWELRQLPYEHPKFYDPVTGYTNWCSHACILIRRAAFEQVEGYDERIFMYGEDVEISYRLRENKWRLKYLPTAQVLHKTYENTDAVKPLQYRGAIFAALYLRARYGTAQDIAAIPFLLLDAIHRPAPYERARRDIWRSASSFMRHALPAFLSRKRKSDERFGFHGLDYEFARDGAYHEHTLPKRDAQPLVSVLTRTMGDRNHLLLEAMHSVANQTYGAVEHVIVQELGDSSREEVERFVTREGHRIKFVAGAGGGRSATGNRALAECSGEFCVFLDDDDLFLSDHIETLMHALDDDAVAAYARAWEVQTEFHKIKPAAYAETAFAKGYDQAFDPDLLRVNNYLPIQAVLFRKRLFDERGGFETDLDALEDWHLWNKYAYGNSFVHVPKTTSMFRVPSDRAERERRRRVHLSFRGEVVRRIHRSVEELREQELAGSSPESAPPTRSKITSHLRRLLDRGPRRNGNGFRPG